MATTSTLPKLLDISELAEHLGTSQRHIRRLIAERRIPYVKVGRLIRFDPAEIATWIDGGRMPQRRCSGRGVGAAIHPQTGNGDRTTELLQRSRYHESHGLTR